MIANHTLAEAEAAPCYTSQAVPAAPCDRLIIVNPVAGRRRARWLQATVGHLRRELGGEVAITRSYANIAELLGAARGARDVAVFGGDGTIAEVVNHIDLGTQHLLLLPGGTGNGLARDLGLTSVERALAAHREGAQRVIDLLEVTASTSRGSAKRLVVSTASLGYVTETVARAGRLPRALGAWRYTIASILQTTHMPALPLRVVVDDGQPAELSLTNLVVNNTRHLGNFSGFRGASLCDGCADMQFAANSFRQQVLQNLGLLTRTYLWSRGQEITARSAHVSSPVPLRLMLDGEIWDGVREVRFTVLPRRLQVYAPGEGNR